MAHQSLVASLKRFTTCDISDGLLKLGLSHGGFLPDLFQRTTPKRGQSLPIVGLAWTVEFVEKTSNRTAEFTGHYIDQIPSALSPAVSGPPGDLGDLPVIPLLGAPAGLTNAVFGGIMALRASILGAPAVVVSGRIRDIGEMNSEGSTTSVFSRGLSTVGAGAYAKPVSIGTTCQVTDFGCVKTGEVIMIDENGVVVIPHSVEIERLIQTMQELTAQDDRVKESVREGASVADAFRKWRTK